VPAEAAARIAAYVRQSFAFDDLAGLEAHLRQVHAPFGPLTDAQWRHLAETSARRLPDGRLAPHYDPAIAAPFEQSATGAVDLSVVWSLVKAPVLLLRGAESDILDEETAAEMATRRGVRLVTLPGIGHAPALMDPAQIALVADWLEGG
jgi:pimeloyl-ACP methyl ester carboxylesterase